MRLVIVLLVLAVLDSQAAAEQLWNRIVAVVNNDIVLLDEVLEASAPLVDRIPAELDPAEQQRRAQALQREVLDTLIADRLLEQQVKELNIEVGEREIDALVTDVQQRNNMTPAQFEQALGMQGLSLSEYRAGMRKQLLKMKIINLKVRSKVKVSEQDVKNLYRQQRSAAAEDLSLKLRQIVILVAADADPATTQAARDRAAQAAGRAAGGEDFAQVARELSEGPNAEGGGLLGTIRPGEMDPSFAAFERTALALAPGQISAPVRTPLGWHVIKLEARQSAAVDEIDKVEQQLRERLMQEELEQAFRRYVEELKTDAFIEIRLADPAGATGTGAHPGSP